MSCSEPPSMHVIEIISSSGPQGKPIRCRRRSAGRASWPLATSSNSDRSGSPMCPRLKRIGSRHDPQNSSEPGRSSAVRPATRPSEPRATMAGSDAGAITSHAGVLLSAGHLWCRQLATNRAGRYLLDVPIQNQALHQVSNVPPIKHISDVRHLNHKDPATVFPQG
jgi:hypothetical protein